MYANISCISLSERGLRWPALFLILFATVFGVHASDNWGDRFVSPPITDGEIRAFARQGTTLYAGGSFSTINGVAANGIAKWNGTSWEPVGTGIDGYVYALAVSGTNLYVGGSFWEAGGVTAMNVAVWNGSSWSALAEGVDNEWFDASVRAIAVNGTNVFVGGRFDTAGTVNATNVARWNGTTWSGLGKGVRFAIQSEESDGAVVESMVWDGTNLYVGGSFDLAGTTTVSNIARWNGAWSGMGSGLTYLGSVDNEVMGSVKALAVTNGTLYAGGLFNSSGGNAVQNLAVWDGTTWSSVGGPVDDGVETISLSGTALYIGGSFRSVDGVPSGSIARWTDNHWESLGSGIGGGPVYALASLGSTLFAGGSFSEAGGALAVCVAKWNGFLWSPCSQSLGNSPIGEVNKVLVTGTNLYVGGLFNMVGSVSANNIACWTGENWQSLGEGVQGGMIFELAADGNQLYAAGFFDRAGSSPAANVARWDGAWHSIGEDLDGSVQAIAVSGTNIVIGGDFWSSNGRELNCVARWNGTDWEPLGAGVNGSVYALLYVGTNLYAGGAFDSAGDVSASGVARWDGSAWHALGEGMYGAVYSLCAAGGNLYAGGAFWSPDLPGANNIAGWNGQEWFELDGGVDDMVSEIAASGTNLFVVGAMVTAGTGQAEVSGIARWTGTTWMPLGYGLDNMGSTVAADGHSVYVGGPFSTAGEKDSFHIGIWDDTRPFLWPDLDVPEQMLSIGDSFEFTIGAVGMPPLSYQWQLNGRNIPGATTTSYSCTNCQLADVGLYTVIVSSPSGQTISSPASVLLDSATLFFDDFESGITNWTRFGSATALTISSTQKHSGTRSALCGSSGSKMYHNLGAEVRGRSRATFWMYDNSGNQNRWLGEVRGYTGAGVGNGTLQQILAIGLYNAPFGTNQAGDLEGEIVCPTNYQGQVLNGDTHGFFNLNESFMSGRSTGWHKFQIERQSDGTTIDYYVDDMFCREIYDAAPAPWDSTLIGSVGSGTVSGNVWFDDVRIEYLDPPEIVTEPVSCVTNRGASVTFSVTAAGTVQSYQWRRGETNIPGATARQLVLSSVQNSDVGEYSVFVGNGIGTVLSGSATLSLYSTPGILVQPQSQTVPAGANVLMQVAADGVPSQLSYQWRMNSTNIPGANSSEYALFDVPVSSAGNYSVVVSNAAGSITSSIAALVITNSKPLILSDPQSQQVNIGANATFIVSAFGNEPRSYQWRFNEVNIPGATSSAYRRTQLQASDAGSYSVMISNAFGVAFSQPATLTLNFPPTITTEPQSQTVSAGAQVVFEVVAQGTEPLEYQWRFNGQDLFGEEQASLVLEDVQSADSGSYSVLVRNIAGQTISATANLLVNGPPSILQQPETQTVAIGSNAVFEVQAVGAGPLVYQWRMNGTNLPGATSTSYTHTNTQAGDVGIFSVLVSNSYGETESDEACLLLDRCVVFSERFDAGVLTNWTVLSNATALVGSTLQGHSSPYSALCDLSSDKMYARLPVEVENHSRVTFWIYDNRGTQTRWFGEVRGYAGDFGAGLEQLLAVGRYDQSFPANQTGELAGEEVDTDYYQGRVFAGIDSGYFNLWGDWDDAPTRSVGWHRFDIERLSDGSIEFSVDGYLGRVNYDANEATWDSVVIGSVGSGSTAGNVWFDDITVEYLDPPLIVADPEDVDVSVGGEATFNVAATGNVLGYQWRLNGTNLPGATASSLVISNVQPGDQGLYSVLVKNGIGPSISIPAALNISCPPQILRQPADYCALSGTEAWFDVEATGSEPLQYQWLFNGHSIANATDTFLFIGDSSYDDAGTYSVIVSNIAGRVASDSALLAVRLPEAPQCAAPLFLNGQLRFSISGETGGTYSVEFSSNLVNWTPLFGRRLTNGVFEFVEEPTNQARFYRALGR